jgi:PAS domain S-box-containing protein
MVCFHNLKNGNSQPSDKSSDYSQSDTLDMGALIGASQDPSGRAVLQRTIDGFLQTAIESAGALRGLLFVVQDGEPKLEAEATNSGNRVTVNRRALLAAGNVLPNSIVRQALRTREVVNVDDALAQNPFSGDAYFAEHQNRSVLCLPLNNGTTPGRILYLENDQTPCAFTPQRVALLKALAAQVVIALENAWLYSSLESREAEVRRKQKQAEEALRSSEAYLVEGQRLTHTGSWAWNPATGTIRYWSEECFRVLGFVVAEAPPHFEAFFQRILVDDQPATRKRFDKAIREKADFQMNYRIVNLEGEIKIIQAVGHPIIGPSGDLTEFVGTVVDITGRVHAEEALRKAFEDINKLKDQLYRENLALRDEVDRASMFEEIVGTSKPLHAVLSRVAKVAPTDSTVLITGETGTGKELIARAVHKRSRRSGRAFVSVNCAALAPSLISSELFGHEKGAFTGAIQRRLGRFELADGGTIFLDEVGELLPDTQAALLRVLQEREFERVGGARSIHVDVRVIAATNRNLMDAVARGSFRDDLFYRLNVFPIAVPSLRERKDDILMLVEYFVQRYARAAGKPIRSIDKRTLELMQSYRWPGNIRELQNVIERSVILSSNDVLSVDESWFSKETPLRTPATGSFEPSFVGRENRSEREIIESALIESRGRVSGPSGAAAKLRVPASTLATRIKALKIDKKQFKFV